MLRVCIAGRSVAGLTAAALLSRSPLVHSVTIMDPYHHQSSRSEANALFSTGLWSAALAVLHHLGVDLSPSSGCVEASGFRSREGVALCASLTVMKPFNGDATQPSLHFVCNDLLLDALGEAVGRTGKMRYAGGVKKVVRSGEGGGVGGSNPLRLTCSNGDEHECDLLIVADGMLSPLREQLTGLPAERFLQHRGYKVYSGYTGERVCTSSFQSWGDGNRFACVPTLRGNQWFATVPSAPQATGIDAVAAGPLSNNSRLVPQEEVQQLQLESFSGWHAEVATLLSSTGAARCCEAIAFSHVPAMGSPLFTSPGDVVFLGDAAFTLDPILAQGAGLAIEEAAVYCFSLLRAAGGSKGEEGGSALRYIAKHSSAAPACNASTKSDLLFRAAKAFAGLSLDRRQRLFWLSNVSQLFGSMRTPGSAGRDALLRATPAAIKGRLFDLLIGVSNGNRLL